MGKCCVGSVWVVAVCGYLCVGSCCVWVVVCGYLLCGVSCCVCSYVWVIVVSW